MADNIYYKTLFGGEVICKGFPNDSGSGNSFSTDGGLAIMEGSENKDAAWSFVRTVLGKDVQIAMGDWTFPTNREAFDMVTAEALAMQDGTRGINSIMIDAPTQEDVDEVLALISSARGTRGWNVDQMVWEIVSEGISDYFSGTSSAQDAARVIQSRVSILVSERS